MAKRLEKSLIRVLTEGCEEAKMRHEGFAWLTHFADYDDFPNSLEIVCIFDTNAQLEQADKNAICQLLQSKLNDMELYLRDMHKHVRFDTEENCETEHKGNWNKRFRVS